MQRDDARIRLDRYITSIASFVFTAKALTYASRFRLGSGLKTSCRCPKISWFTGSDPSTTSSMYLLRLLQTRFSSPSSDDIFRSRAWRASRRCCPRARSRCSTPISSASNASIRLGTCTKVFSSFCVPSSLISFSHRYALTGMPTRSGLVSMMQNAGVAQYSANKAWMSRSAARIFGLVLYHPTIFSLAVG